MQHGQRLTSTGDQSFKQAAKKVSLNIFTASDGSLVVYVQTLCSLALVLGGLRLFLQAFMAKAAHALALEVSAQARARKKVVENGWICNSI